MWARAHLCWREAAQASLESLTIRQRRNGPLMRSERKRAGVYSRARRLRVRSICQRSANAPHLLARPMELKGLILGRSQVVRHRSLEPAFVGSNRPAPASKAEARG